jgi:hypothetical protein
MPGEAGVTVVTMLVCFLFCMRGRERVERPAFPAPSEFQMALCLANLARYAWRDRGGVCVRSGLGFDGEKSAPGLFETEKCANCSKRVALIICEEATKN